MGFLPHMFYNIILTIDYKETNDYEMGTIISQSREAKSKVISGATLKIIVATRVVEEPIIDILPEDDNFTEDGGVEE